MIFLLIGLFLGLIWYIADKSLKERFLPYLKWPSLFVIILMVSTDIFFFVEMERFLKAKAVGGDNGIAYSFFDNNTNLTVQHTMFAKQDQDSATIFVFHNIEYAIMEIILQYWELIAIFLGTVFVLQYLYIVYYNALYNKKQEFDDKKEI